MFYRNGEVGLVVAVEIQSACCPSRTRVNTDPCSSHGDVSRSINGYETSARNPHIMGGHHEKSVYVSGDEALIHMLS